MSSERAKLLARDEESGASAREGMVLRDARDGDRECARDRVARSSKARVMAVTMLAIGAIGACAMAIAAPEAVARAGAALGSRKRSSVKEGSTENCANAAADNAAGTFQIETEECEGAASTVPGCLGSRSACRFCQTHMATHRNHDWPLCPQTVCEEKSVFGCQGTGKESKREIAWRVMREHVLEHNRIVDGIKIGKCSGTSQDRALGRYQYHDSQCATQGLPGCMGSGTSCRFCNIKDAKKATKDWPTCPDVVCDNYDVKKKSCETLTRYNVPDETPPDDWDEKSLPKGLDIDAADVGLDSDSDYGGDEADYEEGDKSASKHHSSKSTPKRRSSDDDYDDDEEEEEERFKDDEEEEEEENAYDDEDDEEPVHHHKHSVGKLGIDEEVDEGERDSSTSTSKSSKSSHTAAESSEQVARDIAQAAEELENERRHEKAVQSTKEAGELDSLVFSSFDEGDN